MPLVRSKAVRSQVVIHSGGEDIFGM
jgi:hypothetical protein